MPLPQSRGIITGCLVCAALALVLVGAIWVRLPVEFIAWALVVFWVVCGICLLAYRQFPGRKMGLMTAWIGPLLTWVWIYEYKCSASAVIGLKSGCGCLMVLGKHMSVMIILATILLVWFLRFYGAFPAYALVGTLLPAKRARVERLAETYPIRWWWLAPLLLFCTRFVMLWTVNRWLLPLCGQK